MKDGFVRVACATPDIRVADCDHNAKSICALARKGAEAGASLIVFPELCVTGYTCGDLFLQNALLEGAKDALCAILAETADLDCVLVLGLPVAAGGKLFNAAAVLLHGRILGLVPKTFIPNYSEFYELRHFTPADGRFELTLCNQSTVLSPRLLFSCANLPHFTLGVEICEDLWVMEPPSGKLAAAGATVIANLSASDEAVGKADYRRSLVTGQSSRLCAAYLYADAGQGESSTDLVFSGHNLIAEYGTLLSESERFTTGLIFADVDLLKLSQERLRMNTFRHAGGMETVSFELPLRELALNRPVSPLPFVPAAGAERDERCAEILAIQSEGLCQRLRHIKGKTVVLGLSGGLDSTLALIVAVRAFDRLGLPRSGIHAISMPGFGTTGRTKNNAAELAKAYGVTFCEIPIGETVLSHFRDIGHDPADTSITYENAQARERTQVLMDVANKLGGIVVGTGDLSELALGWATYNGDHMSMYGVNASVPKTLVRHLVSYEASISPAHLSEVLKDVLATPVSPELLPPSGEEISQKTEDLVGPYELHDFFLYYAVRWGFPPKRIFRLAQIAFQGAYESETVKKWLVVFYRRFFAQQFKRSCLPDGPKVGSVSLSPRGDWRMPSDAAVRLWLKEAEAL
ncbi:MAG: NAD(+) synthase [Christensenellales bacterium]|jgi:NAD+ synthase (glutamine-hydrolysing)